MQQIRQSVSLYSGHVAANVSVPSTILTITLVPSDSNISTTIPAAVCLDASSGCNAVLTRLGHLV